MSETFLSKHPLFHPWFQMKQRCDNENHQSFHRYGGRGITYTEKWETFKGFLDDMEKGWKRGLSLDRIDNNGNYCKENCRWATPKEQAINRRNTRLFELNGEKHTLTDWAEKLGKKKSTLAMRYYAYGWSIEKTLTT